MHYPVITMFNILKYFLSFQSFLCAIEFYQHYTVWIVWDSAFLTYHYFVSIFITLSMLEDYIWEESLMSILPPKYLSNWPSLYQHCHHLSLSFCHLTWINCFSTFCFLLSAGILKLSLWRVSLGSLVKLTDFSE